jgi:hypothetical protein
MYKLVKLMFNKQAVANRAESDEAMRFAKLVEFSFNDNDTVSAFAIVDDNLPIDDIIKILPCIPFVERETDKFYIEQAEKKIKIFNGDEPNIIPEFKGVGNGI